MRKEQWKIYKGLKNHDFQLPLAALQENTHGNVILGDIGDILLCLVYIYKICLFLFCDDKFFLKLNSCRTLIFCIKPKSNPVPIVSV